MGTFLFHTEHLEQVEALDMIQRGKLFTGILRYAAGADPSDIKTEMDPVTFMAFRFIKSQIDRDQEAYMERCERNRENARKRWAGQKKNGMRSHAVASECMHNDNYNDNYKKKDIPKGISKEKAVDADASPPYTQIVQHLNDVCGKHYKDTSKDTRQHINARWAEGWRLPDFLRVIDIKAAEWKGTDMDEFLRPATLFSSKFESYLNQRERTGPPARPGKDRSARRLVNYDQRETDYDALVAAGEIGG